MSEITKENKEGKNKEGKNKEMTERIKWLLP